MHTKFFLRNFATSFGRFFDVNSTSFGRYERRMDVDCSYRDSSNRRRDFDFNSMSFERYRRQMDVETTLFAYKTFLISRFLFQSNSLASLRWRLFL